MMMRAVTITLLLLTGCASTPRWATGGDEFGTGPERRVFLALKEVGAHDAQRAAILQAYDEVQPRLTALADDAEALLGQWRELDRRDPAFTDRAQGLAQRYADVSRERLVLASSFDSRVAGALDAAQWQRWQDYWLRPAFAERGLGPEGDDGPRGGGRRRR